MRSSYGSLAGQEPRISFRALATTCEVRSDVPGLLEELERLLAAFPHENEPGEARFEIRDRGGAIELRRDGEVLSRHPHAGIAIDSLLSAWTDHVLRTAHGFTAIHAASLTRDGLAILFPGPSGSGKSTLAAGLVRGGFGFLSDEAALVEPDTGMVHPFPRPLGLSPTSMRLLGLPPLARDGSQPFYHHEHHVPPEQLRPGCLADPAPVGAVVLPRVSRRGDTAMRPITRSKAFYGLARSLITEGGGPTRAFETLRAVIEGSVACELEIGSLERACDLLHGLADDLG